MKRRLRQDALDLRSVERPRAHPYHAKALHPDNLFGLYDIRGAAHQTLYDENRLATGSTEVGLGCIFIEAYKMLGASASNAGIERDRVDAGRH